MTQMHVAGGPCCFVDPTLPDILPPSLRRESEQPRPASIVPVRVYNSDTQGVCAGCGDSLSTPMHLANGPLVSLGMNDTLKLHLIPKRHIMLTGILFDVQI
jgi:hypothetical protein